MAGAENTWAMRRFNSSLSWARLSLRALILDRESRREASSALSLVRESSSCARPASACSGDREAEVRERPREADPDRLEKGLTGVRQSHQRWPQTRRLSERHLIP